MMMKRINSKCLNVSIHSASLELVDRWAHAGLPRATAQAIMEATSRNRRQPRRDLRSARRKVPVWLVLPYHPVRCEALQRAVRSACKERLLLSMACEDWRSFVLRPSWSNVLSSVERRVLSAGGRGW